MDTIRTLQKKYREERAEQANKRRKESSIRKEILHRADIICTTLSGAGSTSLKQDLEGRLELICFSGHDVTCWFLFLYLLFLFFAGVFIPISHVLLSMR